jgi:hypothetical protein
MMMAEARSPAAAHRFRDDGHAHRPVARWERVVATSREGRRSPKNLLARRHTARHLLPYDFFG